MVHKLSIAISIALILTIIPITTQAAPSEGTLIKGLRDKVYVIENGLKRWIRTADIFNKFGYSWANIIHVSDDLLNNIPPGKDINSSYQYPDGTLLKGSTPPVYLIEKGARRWIPNPQIFEANGFKWQNIVRIPDKILNRIKQDQNIPFAYSSLIHRPQTFILSGPCTQGQTTIPEINTGQIEFAYSGYDGQTSPSNLGFETFLSGYDKNWSSSWYSYKREIDLSAENKIYTFYVRAKTKDGYYDITPAFCKFTTNLSPYHQQVEISSAQGKSTDPNKEKIVLRANRTSESVNITGWTINTKKGNITIPGAVKLVHPESIYNFQKDLILGTSETVTISGGASPIGINSYKLNKCERYFSKPLEYKNCFYENNQYPDFLKNEWRIYLNRTSEFLAEKNEEIILKDKNGLVVDRYIY